VELTSRTLDESRSRAYLAERGIKFMRQVVVSSPDQIEAALGGFEFPLAMKIVSEDIVHKSDSGCVVLDVRDEPAATATYQTIMATALAITSSDRIAGVSIQEMMSGRIEAFIGAKWSDVFGPVLVLGAGGVLVELLQDVSTRLCPVDEVEVESMVSELKIAKLFDGYRGSPACDRRAFVQLALTVSSIISSGEIGELDLNPVFVREDGHGAVPVDARVVLRNRAETGAQAPQSAAADVGSGPYPAP
jgi:acyl-CoA synthetase (NDP forming)